MSNLLSRRPYSYSLNILMKASLQEHSWHMQPIGILEDWLAARYQPGIRHLSNTVGVGVTGPVRRLPIAHGVSKDRKTLLCPQTPL